MRAMVFAAGLGTRLRPLTDDRPKALVELNGRTLLEITLARLREFGVHDVIINVHHFADMFIDYLKSNQNFGMNIEVSREQVLLDTGGGLKQAAHFFLNENDDSPFIVHNVDVVSTIDLRRMAELHDRRHALATLAVMDRKTSRYLLFDDQQKLCGRLAGVDRSAELARPVAADAQALAFCGIHIISPRFLMLTTEQGAFSIIDAYLRLAAQGETIFAFRADGYQWRDLGKPENVIAAEREIMEREGKSAVRQSGQ
jgi:NDP-sugar pyrophosphorylase family protein